MAAHSSTLAWQIPWTEEPSRLQSTGSLRVGHDWATSLSLFTFMHWRRKWQPTPVFCLENPRDSGGWILSLENPRDSGAWWAAVYGVAQSRTQLKWLSIHERHQRMDEVDQNTDLVLYIPNLLAFYLAQNKVISLWKCKFEGASRLSNPLFASHCWKLLSTGMCWG